MNVTKVNYIDFKKQKRYNIFQKMKYFIKNFDSYIWKDIFLFTNKCIYSVVGRNNKSR